MKGPNSLFYNTAFILFCLVLLSCSGPTIHYLGESYGPSASVEVYYDAKEVKKEYKVMGRMTNDKFMEYDIELIKKKMIEKAKLVGADAVIFYDLSAEEIERVGDGISVKAQLIKYL